MRVATNKIPLSECQCCECSELSHIENPSVEVITSGTDFISKCVIKGHCDTCNNITNWALVTN